jgi:hypothetical protein
MRLHAWGSILPLLALVACSPGTLGSPTGAGGTTSTGGTTGAGGTIGAGGATSTGGSPGTATLRISLPPTQSFCDENPSCTTTQHLWISDATGQTLQLGSVGCQLDCRSCTYPPCPEVPVIACPAGNFGVPVTDYDFTWDGGYVASGGCTGTTGATALACVYGNYASPGKYVARFCATPGTLGTSDGGAPVCTPTGAQECVEVGFLFPSSQPVMITLLTD